jgi:hypothetical protein
LQTVDLAARLARQVDNEDDDFNQPQNGNMSYGNVTISQRTVNTNDGFSEYEEEYLDDERSLRRYPNGTVRLQNHHSGIMQEERPDGSLLISLPDGKVLYQRMGGESVLVMDTNSHYAPKVAQVSAVRIPNQDEPALVFHFQDRNGTHLIEMETLRYFRAKVA